MVRPAVFKALCILLVATATPVFAAATAVGWFAIRTPGTEDLVRITSARLGDKINFLVRGTAADGDHALLLRVYDGNGREAFKGESTVTARMGMWGTGLGYGLKRGTDSAGIWWFVIDLDGQTVLSSSLEVAP